MDDNVKRSLKHFGKEKKLLEQKEALVEARQSFIDDLTGFSSDSVGKEVRMDDNVKRSLKQLVWSVLITVINGLITIFNPSTKEVAETIVNSLNC